MKPYNVTVGVEEGDSVAEHELEGIVKTETTDDWLIFTQEDGNEQFFNRNAVLYYKNRSAEE